MANKPLLVAAIDFGTTFSGVAYSFRHDYEREPTKVYTMRVGNINKSKTMTCILIKPDGETFYKFGDDADSYYYEDLDTIERKEWYLFKRFKMELYDADLKGLNIQQLLLKDVSGRELPAKRVFSLTIRFFKDEVLQVCSSRITGMVEASEIRWVLTVPAIWHDQAKGLMREAAEEAGISRDRLIIALEPEAASIFCQHVPLVRDQTNATKLVPFKVGMKYIVVDCGGGTVDITVHQVTDKAITTLDTGSSSKCHFVKEIRKARGNDMGGTKVDDEFVKYLEKLLVKDDLKDYKSTHDESFRDMMIVFEDKKRSIKADGANMIIPLGPLVEYFAVRNNKTLEDHVIKSGITGVSFLNKDRNHNKAKIRFENNVVRSFFARSIRAIISKLDEVLREPDMEDCNTLLMVGGYSESPLLISRIKDLFPLKEIICPTESGLAVLKGAVIFGHNPGAISERVSQFTYGTGLVGNRFSKLVKIGDRLEVGKNNRVQIYHPHSDAQTSVLVNIYVSPRETPKFLDEEGCVRIIQREFPMPDTTGGTNRSIEMCMEFGGTEFKVHVKNVDTGYQETFYVTSWD